MIELKSLEEKLDFFLKKIDKMFVNNIFHMLK